MRILVTGATGYLGNGLAAHLAAAGHAVTGLSRSAAGDARVSAAGATPLRGDLADLPGVVAAMRGHDATIHAAQLDIEAEFAAVSGMVAGVSGTDHRFILTSGTGVLAQRTDGDWSEDCYAEDEAFVPSRYVGQRLVAETLVRTASVSGALRGMVVRPPAIWGNGGAGHLRLFYGDALRHGFVGYLGAGLNLYSNVHVEDLAEVYRLALERGTPGALYHAVAGEVNNRTLAQAVAADLGLPARPIGLAEAIARWGKFETLVGMASSSRSRSPRTRRELGWAPRHLDMLSEVGHPAYRALAGAAPAKDHR